MINNQAFITAITSMTQAVTGFEDGYRINLGKRHTKRRSRRCYSIPYASICTKRKSHKTRNKKGRP